MCGETRLSIPAFRAARRTASQITFVVMGLVSAPTIDRAREEVRLRSHPAVVLTQSRSSVGTERHVAIAATLPSLDMNQHAPAIDVPDLQLAQFRIAHAGRDKTISIVRCDSPSAASITRAFSSTLRICGSRRGALGYGVSSSRYPTLQRLHEEEAQRRDVEAHRQRSHLPLVQQIRWYDRKCV